MGHKMDKKVRNNHKDSAGVGNPFRAVGRAANIVRVVADE